MDSFPKLVNDFFVDVADISQLRNSSLFLCRADGVPLYSNNGLGEDVSEASVGALLGGVWQAARTLASFIPDSEGNQDIFRLSFDTSSRGIYIVPTPINGEEFYLGMIYFSEVNPGQVKSRLRDLSFKFVEYIESISIHLAPEVKDEFLFDDISDDEMDNLFTFGGA